MTASTSKHGSTREVRNFRLNLYIIITLLVFSSRKMNNDSLKILLIHSKLENTKIYAFKINHEIHVLLTSNIGF
jgi:hypothetical protein